MKFKYGFVFCFSLLIMGCKQPEKSALHNPQILPAPVFQEQLDGVFELNQQTVLDNQPHFNITATFMTDFLKSSNIDLKNGAVSSNYITILKDNRELYYTKDSQLRYNTRRAARHWEQSMDVY